MRQDAEEGTCLSGIDVAILSGGFVSGGCGSSGDARESESSDELQSVLSEGEALRAASALLLLLLLTHTHTHTNTHTHTHTVYRVCKAC